jgi:hypothetical protein
LAVASTAVAIVGTVFWVMSRPKDPVREHLDAIRSLETSWAAPSSLRDYVRPQVWRWFFRGRPDLQATVQQMEKHKQALVELGYFENRAFPLHRRTLDSGSRPQFDSLRTNVSFCDNHWTMSTTGAQSSVVFIRARRVDMPLWSNIVYRFDQTDPP